MMVRNSYDVVLQIAFHTSSIDSSGIICTSLGKSTVSRVSSAFGGNLLLDLVMHTLESKHDGTVRSDSSSKNLLEFKESKMQIERNAAVSLWLFVCVCA